MYKNMDIKKIVKRIDDIYDFLYNHPEAENSDLGKFWLGYGECIIHHAPELLQALNKERGDMFVSNREVIALGYVMDQVSRNVI